MRTKAEMIARYKESTDMFGFDKEAIFEFFDDDDVKALLGVDSGERLVELEKELKKNPLNPLPLTRESVVACMRKYMAFAWEKAEDHRGISASRSIIKMRVWLWILCDDETIAFLSDENNYPQYGAPMLAHICEKYNFPIPEAETVQRMVKGLPCSPSCEMGCGEP